MKVVFFICSIILNSAIAFGQYAEFHFDKRVYKADPVEEGVMLEHTFNFQNSGKVPLIITGYDVTCSCTRATYPEEPILPGEEGQIHVTFDTNDKIGWQYRKVVLRANTKKPAEVEIRVKILG
jgi:hypothetical protein